jgi:hypothetical protein
MVTSKGHDLFSVLTSIQNVGLPWRNCTAVCSNYAPPVIVLMAGFASLVKKRRHLSLFLQHCFLLKEVVVSKSFGIDIKESMDNDTETVNVIKQTSIHMTIFKKPSDNLDKECIDPLLHGSSATYKNPLA